jgi:hypothetical protein
VGEWYVNGPLGLEQGFTIQHRLAGGGAPVTVSLAVGGLRPLLERGGGSVAFEAGSRVMLRYGGLLATDARGARLAAWLAVRPGRIQIRLADRGARYPVRIDPFVQQGAKLVGTGAAGEADRGSSVALSAHGNTALVGGWVDNGRRGAAWVFTRSGSTWTQQGPKLVGTGAVGAAEQGASVALSGDGNTALIGGRRDNNGIGASWVFGRSGSTWTQQGPKLVGAGVTGNSFQGESVALSGDGSSALVGGNGDNGGTGATWVFTRSGSTWTQQGPKLVGTGAVPTPGLGDYQGGSVALSGDGGTALIGGMYDHNRTGAAWVFTRSGSTWTQQGTKLVGTGAVAGQYGGAEQGESVALSGDGNTALIGGPTDNNTAGATWVFTRSGSTWTQQGPKLVGTGSVDPARRGFSLALSGDGNRALIGGPDANNHSGGAWMFTRSGSTWTQQGPKLVGAGAVDPAYQGTGVALSADGSTALLGGDGDSNGAGAAWVFVSDQPPTITSFSPGSGITGSGVTITGTNFDGPSSVKFGSLVASSSIVSATQIKATVPDGAIAARVSVKNSAGTATSAQNFAPTLSATGLSPTSGPVGTVVDIKGIGFTSGSAVSFNGSPATTVSYVNSGEVRATVPAGASSGPVTLATAAGTVRARGKYTLTPSIPPTVSSFTPTSGITGTTVTITGTYLSGANSVKFGSLAANFRRLPPTHISATVPNGATAAKITVTTGAGTATSTQNFTPALSITGYSPTGGPVGTVVDIKGIGFTAGSTVKFNGTPATTITYLGPGEVKATVPAGATTGPITLTTGAGTIRGRDSYTITTTTTTSGTRPIPSLAITTPLPA